MSKVEKTKEEVQTVPLWVVSFGDMVTNLLACFVLIQSLATTRDRTLFNAGLGSFQRAIAQYGLPDWLFGRQQEAEYDYKKIKYPTEEAEPEEPSQNRVIDAEDEQIREIFDQLSQQMRVEAADVADAPIEVFLAPIVFSRGKSAIDRAGEEFLRNYAATLTQKLSAQRLKVYVIGLAADEEDRKSQWLVSSARARAAREGLATFLAPKLRGGAWEVQCWGAGAGGEWCRRTGVLPQGSYIIIAVMKAG